jgi:hypothetical protein
MTNETLTQRMKIVTKSYLTSVIFALGLACSGYAEEYNCIPKTITTKNVRWGGPGLKGEEYANLAMVIEKNGTNYLAKTLILPKTEGNPYVKVRVLQTAAEKATIVEALVEAEIARGTNGLVKIIGELDEKNRIMEINRIVVDGHEICTK